MRTIYLSSSTFMTNRPIGLLMGLLLLCSTARAEEMTLSTAVPLTVPRKQEPRGGGPLDKVEVSIWLPDKAAMIRGAVFNPFNLKTTEQKHWQEAARLWGFAVIGANYFAVPAKDYAATLHQALKEFAQKSGHRELEHLPLCFVGMSAGAGMSIRFAEQMPERTIAVAAVCLEVGPTGPVTRKIPMVTIFGEKDGQQLKLLAAKLPAQRKEGALWATAIQWGRRHEFGAANNLLLPFFDEVIRRRCPAAVVPTEGPLRLLDYVEADGALGDSLTWSSSWPVVARHGEYSGEKAAACWLPSVRVASIWRAFVSRSSGIRITAPAALGDGQPFTTHPADSPLEIKVELGDGKMGRVELFDGDVSLGTRTEAPFDFQVKLLPGIHSLIAVVSVGGTAQAVSKPVTVILTRHD